MNDTNSSNTNNQPDNQLVSELKKHFTKLIKFLEPHKVLVGCAATICLTNIFCTFSINSSINSNFNTMWVGAPDYTDSIDKINHTLSDISGDTGNIASNTSDIDNNTEKPVY